MSDNLTLYKQIHPAQCQKVADMGYRCIINIRPDGESAQQPTSAALQSACHAALLCYYYLPFDEDRLSLSTIEHFAALYREAPKPVLMFCGTGNRAKLLYQSALMQGLL